MVILMFLVTGLAAVFLGSKLLQNTHFWMTAERVPGEIIDQGRIRRGYSPIVSATRGDQTFQLRFGQPSTSEPPALGTPVTVLVPASGVVDARVYRATELFLVPALGMLMFAVWFALMAAATFTCSPHTRDERDRIVRSR